MTDFDETKHHIYDFHKNPALSNEEKMELRSMIENAPSLASENMNDAILKGQYRLSYHLFIKLFKLKTSVINRKNQKDLRKTEYSITKMELLLLLLLLQICDSNNHIQDFSYSKDIEPLKDYNGEPLFKKSTFYHALNSLERKKIITKTELDNGMLVLSIPGNTIGKKGKYITLQTEYLLHDSIQYLAFRDMKLAAMKIYLLFLAKTYKGKDTSGKAVFNGNPEMSINDIITQIGVQQNRTVRSYIQCLEKAFGKLSFFPGYGKKSFSHGKLQLINNNNRNCFSKRQSFSENQLSSFRRHFDSVIKRHNINFIHTDYENIRNWMFRLINYPNKLSSEKTFAFAMSRIISHGALDYFIFNEICYTIANV